MTRAELAAFAATLKKLEAALRATNGGNLAPKVERMLVQAWAILYSEATRDRRAGRKRCA